MNKEDFKDISNPEFMESVEQIIKNRGTCHNVDSAKCPFNALNSNDSRYCVSAEHQKVRHAKEFKKMVEKDNKESE